MSRFSKLSTLAKSAAVALALGGASLAAVPAQAAPPSFDFHFGFGGGGISIGGGKYCLSDRQVRRFLQWQGYDQIRYTACLDLALTSGIAIENGARAVLEVLRARS